MQSVTALGVLDEDICPYNVGWHQIRRALYTSEGQPQNLTERLHEQRFAKPREPFEQDMSLTEETNQQLLHQLSLPYKGLANFPFEVREVVSKSRPLFGHGLHICCLYGWMAIKYSRT